MELQVLLPEDTLLVVEEEVPDQGSLHHHHLLQEVQEVAVKVDKMQLLDHQELPILEVEVEVLDILLMLDPVVPESL